jgi:hypothetical protein
MNVVLELKTFLVYFSSIQKIQCHMHVVHAVNVWYVCMIREIMLIFEFYGQMRGDRRKNIGENNSNKWKFSCQL